MIDDMTVHTFHPSFHLTFPPFTFHLTPPTSLRHPPLTPPTHLLLQTQWTMTPTFRYMSHQSMVTQPS